MNPKKLQSVAIALLYYGLLRISEVKTLTIDNVTIKSEKKLRHLFIIGEKRKNKGFMFNVLVTFYNMFIKYV